MLYMTTFRDSDLLEGAILDGQEITDGVTIYVDATIDADDGFDVAYMTVTVTGRMTEDGEALDDVGPVEIDDWDRPYGELLASAVLTNLRDDMDEARAERQASILGL